jgi:hypothetical protein
VLRRTLVAVVLACLTGGALPASAAVRDAPPGATARCRDGTYSFSAHHSGTCSHHGGVARWLDGGAAPVGAAIGVVAAPRAAVGATVLLRARTRATGCVRGVEPDRRCSPGAVSAGLTKDVICAAGFHTSSIRNVPETEKHQVEAEYGMAQRPYGSTLEIDHIVSLELGGSNDIANLFPERAPGYHLKDRLENRLHALVCSGRMTLRAAQRGIAANWQRLYASVFGAAP